VTEEETMQSRMKNVATVLPAAMHALQALSKVSREVDLPPKTLGLVHLRASQINGCSVCLDMHPRMAKEMGETEQRMFTVAGWRDAPHFTEAERAALALTEAVTRLADSPDPVPDAVWTEAARHFDERQLAGLLVAIVAINCWNRLNVATRQIAGAQSW
jgi:AhpD family alkylhydroperoxidase